MELFYIIGDFAKEFFTAFDKIQLEFELSFYKACKLLIISVSDLVPALASSYRFKLFLNSFYESLSLFAIKNIKMKTIFGLHLSTGDDF
ncbi:hypothetical protein OQJ26_18695 [Legionella sp. PATHC038]|uniref:hypothetical protein n=1 Tax=Legionella sheltonii TaxID=2992041 RepID=UPI002243232A|nr:hypothetical protein [Legionella sp. PATHC038]MCW8400815.1 hypothetical protein [Legionella sp. PATHC038]